MFIVWLPEETLSAVIPPQAVQLATLRCLSQIKTGEIPLCGLNGSDNFCFFHFVCF
jgi:hypothetical protein